MARTKRLIHSNIIRPRSGLIYGEYLTLVLDVTPLSRLILIAILIRTARCLLCKPHFSAWGLFAVCTAEASGKAVGTHLLCPDKN